MLSFKLQKSIITHFVKNVFVKEAICFQPMIGLYSNAVSYSTLRNVSSPTSQVKNLELMSAMKKDIKIIFSEIQSELSSRKAMNEMANYYFDGTGKSLRPLIILIMSQAINEHQNISEILKSQREIAKVTEMIHTSSLLHDDVIDDAVMRRGKLAVHSKYSNKQSVMTGDFVISVASSMLAKLECNTVIKLITQALVDLVEGEFMQLKQSKTDRFDNYIQKSYNKTASLIAMSCKSVAVLAKADHSIQEASYEYGKNTGIAFQLIDDMLDYTATSNTLGKPTHNDLKSGLATAPVLFACEKFPELNELIDRNFKNSGDIELVMDLVEKSDAIAQTKNLAVQHCEKAIQNLRLLKPSCAQEILVQITNDIISRKK